MQRSESLTAFAKAFVAFQAELESVKKDSNNPFFNSKYADLAAIIDVVRPILAKHKLGFMQFPQEENFLLTIVIHESGEFMQEAWKMEPMDKKPQTLGSCITYQRRYSLGAILGIATEEDDDGNAASHGQSALGKKPPYRKPASAAAQPTEPTVVPLKSAEPAGLKEGQVMGPDGTPVYTCAECQTIIPDVVANYSFKMHGKRLCRVHQTKK